MTHALIRTAHALVDHWDSAWQDTALTAMLISELRRLIPQGWHPNATPVAWRADLMLRVPYAEGIRIYRYKSVFFDDQRELELAMGQWPTQYTHWQRHGMHVNVTELDQRPLVNPWHEAILAACMTAGCTIDHNDPAVTLQYLLAAERKKAAQGQQA